MYAITEMLRSHRVEALKTSFFCYKNYGMVPQDVMPGIEYGDSLPNHNELDAVAEAYVQAIGKGKQSKLSRFGKKA